MLFRQFFDLQSSSYTYLLAEDQGADAILIDPVRNQIDLYIDLLQELQLTLIMTIDTHTHADHVTAAGLLQKKFHSSIVMGEQAPAECVSIRVKDRQQIKVGNLTLTALYTPGHTNDSYCFYMDDRIFTGDTLLIRGTGRTDFQEGDPYKQYDSLFNKILPLPEATQVYPAHNYRGINVSTIGEEKKHNPRLQVSSPDEYASIMNELNLAKPQQMDVAVPANLKCGLTE